MTPRAWPTAQQIDTRRLRLEPLRIEHAEEMAVRLDDPGLHAFTGGRPATVDELRARYARQVVGHSADAGEGWLNWIVRLKDTRELAGTVQATVRRGTGPHLCADVAWVVASSYQGQGIASEASMAMVEWLRDQGVNEIVALIHPDHSASSTVARHLGLGPTRDVVDGEVRWVSDLSAPRGS